MNDEQLGTDIKRVFDRYRATSAADFAATHPSERPAGFRRPALARLSAGGVLLAAVLATAALILQPFAPASRPASVFASWSDVPTSPDPAMADWASSHCYGAEHPLLEHPLLLQDQRGRASYFVFGEGSDLSTCMVWIGTDGWTSFVWPSPLQGSDPLIQVSPESRAYIGIDSIDGIVGRAPGAAAVVIYTPQGQTIHASVRDGLFAAWWWWPMSLNKGAMLREIRAYGPDGRLVADWLAPPTSPSPRVSGAPTGS
jgi:hypothetical protein